MRVLEIDLGRLAAGAPAHVLRVDSASPIGRGAVARRLAQLGGGALALALLEERVELAHPVFVIALGSGVRRELPTAARATLAGRYAVGGVPEVAQAQVGGGLAQALAPLADALLIHGQLERPGALLCVDEAGARLLHDPRLAGADEGPTEQLARGLAAGAAPPGAEHAPEVSVLRIGPAGEALLRSATLVVGTEPGARVGRGGLAAAFGRLGLKALAIHPGGAEPLPARPSEEPGARELVAALLRSPRLEARARGGSLELFEAGSAAGELDQRARGDSAEGLARHEGRHGCRGCPTPCGWVLTGLDAGGAGADGRTRARFNALQPLTGLGLDLEGARSVLAECDRLGLDARAAGRWLAAEVGSTDVHELKVALRAAIIGRTFTDVAESRGDPSSPVGSPSRAAIRAGRRGREAMRAFPFLVEHGVDTELVARVVAPLPIAPRAQLDAQLGRLVWWHENLSTALDAVGFCQFSAAGLLADGVLGLEQLAAALAPAGGWPGAAELGPGLAMIAAGADLVALEGQLQAGVDPPLGAASGPELEYSLLRRAPGEGASRLAACFEECRRIDAGEAGSQPPSADPAVLPTAVGTLTLLGHGPLRGALGGSGELCVEAELPAPLVEVLALAARARPEAAALLLIGSAPRPTVYRDGQRLSAGDLVATGDRLELVLALAGG